METIHSWQPAFGKPEVGVAVCSCLTGRGPAWGPSSSAEQMDFLPSRCPASGREPAPGRGCTRRRPQHRLRRLGKPAHTGGLAEDTFPVSS